MISENDIISVDLEGVTSLSELETLIERKVTEYVDSLNTQWKTISEEIDTYRKYCDQSQRVSDFYLTVTEETEKMCLMLREYSAVYARMILDSDMTDKKKYRAVEDLKEALYDDACEMIHDEIYDGLLDEMHDHFYDGILEKREDGVDYSEWYDISSAEYSQWYDAGSDVYSAYYDAGSDIYSFYYDLGSELYSADFERAEKVYARFLKKIAKAKGISTGDESSDAVFDVAVRSFGNAEELETVIEAQVEECIQALNAEWKQFAAEIDTFEKFTENSAAVEEFHEHIEESAAKILTMICDYGVVYADMIMQSEGSAKDKYNAFEDFRDILYEDACKAVKDAIYEDLLKEVEDYYYEGIVKDARDSVSYSEWADARSDAYGWWADAHSEVYGSWSDTRSELYGFCSDIRSKLFGGDLEKAEKELERFRKKVEKMHG